MPVSSQAEKPDQTRPAATAVALGPQRTVRPWSHADRDQPDPVRHWERLLDAGLIANRNPPPSPEVVASRNAADAPFRGIAADRCLIRRHRA